MRHQKHGGRIHNRRGCIWSRFRKKIKLVGVVRGDPLCNPPLRIPELKGRARSWSGIPQHSERRHRNPAEDAVRRFKEVLRVGFAEDGHVEIQRGRSDSKGFEMRAVLLDVFPRDASGFRSLEIAAKTQISVLGSLPVVRSPDVVSRLPQ